MSRASANRRSFAPPRNACAKTAGRFFEATATELNAGQMYIGSLEGRVQKILKNLRRPRRVVWIIPNLHELQHTGAHNRNPMGALDMLLPAIDDGSIAVIGEVPIGAQQKLVSEKPRVGSAFASIRIDPLPDADAFDVARAWVAQRAPERIDAPLVREAWQLASQYLGTRAAPGNVLTLLERTLARVESAPIGLDNAVRTLAELTGLPLDILDERVPLDLATLRAQFESRVLGQSEAIDTLVARMAMIKAGVTDPTRPLGVFLFAGPTGTGKTEIAKTLATTLFGSAERMLRVDMSELQTPDSLSRIVGNRDGSVRSLLDDIRKQPFSVVLLDEMEKAHPRVLDLFLQVFDDGRLTGRCGNTGDFRQAILILTSNLGAATPTIGLRASENANIEQALRRELRREFLNRIDRIVVFRPLARETMRGILRKELRDALHRRGLRNRKWTLEWDESAIDFLLTAGFTEDLGARPLKRAIERHVLTPLAELIVSRREPERVRIRAENGVLVFSAPSPSPAARRRNLDGVVEAAHITSLMR